MSKSDCEKCYNLGYHNLRWVGQRANGKNGCQIVPAKTPAPTAYPSS